MPPPLQRCPSPVERKLDYNILGWCPTEVTVDSTGKPAQSLGPDLRAKCCPEQPAFYRQWVRIPKLFSKQTRPAVTLKQLGRHSVKSPHRPGFSGGEDEREERHRPSPRKVPPDSRAQKSLDSETQSGLHCAISKLNIFLTGSS